MKKYLIIWMILLTNFYAQKTISLDLNLGKLDNFHISYYKDTENVLTYEKIKDIKFDQIISNRFSLGYLNHPVWFKIRAYNNSTKKNSYILAFEEPFWDSTTLYYETPEGVQKTSNTIYQNIEEKSIPHANDHFRIFFEPNETLDIYVRVESKFATFSEVFFYSEQYYSANVSKDYFLYLIYFGAIGVIAFYNLVLYLYLRESSYLFYFGYTICFGMWIGLFSGLVYNYIPSKYGYSLHFVTPLFIAFLVLFSNKVLALKEHYPLIYKISIINLYFIFFLVVWIPFDISRAIQWVSVVGSYTFFIYFVVSFLMGLKGDKVAKYYFIAIGIFLFSTSSLSLMTLGVFPNTLFTRYIFIVGSFIEIIMFSLLLAFRIDIIRKSYQQKLENEVSEKTKSINVQNKQLQELLKEKEILINEILHRVKNNFQILIAHLSVESMSEKNELIKKHTQKINSKIKSLSVVNDMLYSQNEDELIDVKDYFEVFFPHIIDKTVRFDLKIQSLSLPAKIVKKLGLLVNEMITNTLKHQLHNEEFIIYFSLHKEKNDILVLEYKDSQKKSKEGDYIRGYGTVFIEDFTESFKNCTIKKGDNEFHYIMTLEI